MTNKDEALKLALEALELEDMACRYEKDPTPEHIAKAITAIREALAEQPVIQQGWDVDDLLDKPKQPARQQDMPKIGCVNHDCDKCKAQQQESIGWEYVVHLLIAAGYVSQEKVDHACTIAKAQQQEPVAKDAEEWGGRLNQASWAAIEAWDAELMGPMSGAVFNNIKGVVRAAILKYVEGYTSPAASKPLTDAQIKTRTDEQIEAAFKRCGGRWNGDHWVIEDADLHPFVRTIEGADLNTLRAISDEYNAWIKHHAAGHSYDDFLAKREAAHGIKGNRND